MLIRENPLKQKWRYIYEWMLNTSNNYSSPPLICIFSSKTNPSPSSHRSISQPFDYRKQSCALHLSMFNKPCVYPNPPAHFFDFLPDYSHISVFLLHFTSLRHRFPSQDDLVLFLSFLPSFSFIFVCSLSDPLCFGVVTNLLFWILLIPTATIYYNLSIHISRFH